MEHGRVTANSTTTTRCSRYSHPSLRHSRLVSYSHNTGANFVFFSQSTYAGHNTIQTTYTLCVLLALHEHTTSLCNKDTHTVYHQLHLHSTTPTKKNTANSQRLYGSQVAHTERTLDLLSKDVASKEKGQQNQGVIPPHRNFHPELSLPLSARPLHLTTRRKQPLRVKSRRSAVT